MDRQPRQLAVWGTLLLSVCIVVAVQAVGSSNPALPNTRIAPSVAVAGTLVVLSPIAIGKRALAVDGQKNFLPIVIGGGENSTTTPTDGIGTPSPSATATNTATETPTTALTETPSTSPGVPSDTATATTGAATATATATIMGADTATATNTGVIIATVGATATATRTATTTRTATATGTLPTATNTPSRTPTTTATFTIQTGLWSEATQVMTSTHFYVNADHITLTTVGIYLKECNATFSFHDGQIISYAFDIAGTDGAGLVARLHGEFISPTTATGTWSITGYPGCSAGSDFTSTWTAHPLP